MWFILISSWACSHPFFSVFFGGKSYIDWPITNFFWNIGHYQIEAPLWWTLSCKIETNVLPLAHLLRWYTWELNFGQTNMGVELRCYWERLEEPGGNTLGTREENQLNKWSKFKVGKISWVFFVLWIVVQSQSRTQMSLGDLDTVSYEVTVQLISPWRE